MVNEPTVIDQKNSMVIQVKQVQQELTNIPRKSSDSYTKQIGHEKIAERFRQYEEEDTKRDTKRIQRCVSDDTL